MKEKKEYNTHPYYSPSFIFTSFFFYGKENVATFFIFKIRTKTAVQIIFLENTFLPAKSIFAHASTTMFL